MNIVLFIYGIDGVDRIGGAEVFTRRLADALVKRGHSTTLLTTQSIKRWLGGQPIVEHVNGLRIIRLPVSYSGKFRIFARMMLLETIIAFPLLMRRAQILHIRKLDAEAINLGHIAHFWKVKTLCIPMASGPYGDVSKFPTVKRHDARAIDWLSALTEHIRQEVIEWGFSVERTGVISNGVDTAFFGPSSEAVSQDRVIYVGQFRPEKRIGLLLEAWRQVQITHPQAQLTLIGGASLTPKYQQMAADMGIDPKFISTASSLDVRHNLQMNSIFILSGVSEGMSNALLEAMSVGLACIASDTPGNRVLIDPEINGLVYDSESPEALATQLRRLLDDKTLRERLGNAARQTIISTYSLDSVADQYIDLYKRIIAGM